MNIALLDSTVAQTREVAAWVDEADPSTAIPTCPGWTLADLVGHIGATHRWVSRLVDENISDPGTAFSIDWEPPPTDPSAWAGWLRGGASRVAETFAAATGEHDVFDPSGGGDGVAFWSQRIFDEITRPPHRRRCRGEP